MLFGLSSICSFCASRRNQESDCGPRWLLQCRQPAFDLRPHPKACDRHPCRDQDLRRMKYRGETRQSVRLPSSPSTHLSTWQCGSSSEPASLERRSTRVRDHHLLEQQTPCRQVVHVPEARGLLLASVAADLSQNVQTMRDPSPIHEAKGVSRTDDSATFSPRYVASYNLNAPEASECSTP